MSRKSRVPDLRLLEITYWKSRKIEKRILRYERNWGV